MQNAQRQPRKNHLELARQILELVQQHALAVGAHLPEQRYATLCNVSRTPVRAAFKLLEKKGTLAWSNEAGYTLAASLSSMPTPANQLSNAAESDLAQAILRDKSARRLGNKVSISEMMRRYNTDRKTVLNSIKELSDDGVLIKAAGQSWVFKQLQDSSETLQESLDYRFVLEPAAILAPGFILDGHMATALRQGVENLLLLSDKDFSVAEYQRLDQGFHNLIAQCTSNRFLSDALIGHLKLTRVISSARGVNVYRQRQAMLEHLKMLDYLESQQYDIAADLLRIHLKLSRPQRPTAAGRGAPTLLGLSD